MQSARSKAVRKYEAKIGMGTKSYKLNLELARQFKNVCDANGLSQSSVLTEFMKGFIKKNTKTETSD